MDSLIYETRCLICEQCSGCEFKGNSDFILNKCSVCPLKKWDKFGCFEGVGDVVEVLAKPIAKTIDTVTSILPRSMQTDLVHCGGCQKRKEALNKIIPFQ